MLQKVRPAWLILNLIAVVGPASADPIVFTDEASFVASPAVRNIETFDSFRQNFGFTTPQIALGGVQFTTATCTNRCWTFDSSTFTPPNGLISNAISDDVLSFGAGRYSTALGFSFQSTAFGPGWTIAIRELNGSVTNHDIGPLDAVEPIYVGFLSDRGIVDVTIANRPGGIMSNWRLDDVARGTVLGGPTLPDSRPIPPPALVAEPTTLVLAASGLLGLRRRRRG